MQVFQVHRLSLSAVCLFPAALTQRPQAQQLASARSFVPCDAGGSVLRILITFFFFWKELLTSKCQQRLKWMDSCGWRVFSLWREHLRDVIAGGWMNGLLEATLTKATKCQETLPAAVSVFNSVRLHFKKVMCFCLSDRTETWTHDRRLSASEKQFVSLCWQTSTKKGKLKLISYFLSWFNNAYLLNFSRTWK